MAAALAAIAVLARALWAAPEAPRSGVALEYRRPLGQVAEYRLSLDVRGEEISLGERRPVRLRAEIALTEEVVAHEREGAMWVRVVARPVEVRDGGGTFAGRGGAGWPAVQFRVTPRGEVLEVSPATGEYGKGPWERALVSLLAQPAPVILPAGPVEVGEEWEGRQGGAHQRSRLVAVSGVGAARTARISSEGSSPLELAEASDALGLATTLSGEAAQSCVLDLLMERGVPTRQQGEISVRTRSQATLALPEGPRRFEMQGDLQVAFDLRLVRLDGETVGTH